MKKSLRLIALVLALVALVGLSACQKGDDTQTTTETPTTTEAKLTAADLVGEWRFNADNLSSEKFVALCSDFAASVVGDTSSINDLLAENLSKESFGKLFGAFALRFAEDGTCTTVVYPEDFAAGYEALVNSVFAAMGEMSLEDAAAMSGVTVEALEASLNGATWKEYCVQRGEITVSSLKAQMTADGVAAMFGGTAGEDGAVVAGAGEKYAFDGETLTLGNASVKVTVNDGEISFGAATGTLNDTYKELVESGCTLVKAK